MYFINILLVKVRALSLSAILL